MIFNKNNSKRHLNLIYLQFMIDLMTLSNRICINFSSSSPSYVIQESLVLYRMQPKSANSISQILNHQLFLLPHDWSKRVAWLNIPPVKGNIWVIFPAILNTVCCKKKKLKDNKHNSIHLGQKYTPILLLGHYLLLKAPSFFLYLCSR